MKVSALTSLILQINSLIDSGKYNDITIDNIHGAIKKKKVLQFLKDRAAPDIDLSIYLDADTYGDFEPYYETKINEIYGGYAGRERKKWGIENSGLCLILAWTNEIIQQGEDLEWA